MTWPFENDTGAVIRKLSNARLRQHHFRNRLIGVIIFMAAIMAFVFSLAVLLIGLPIAILVCREVGRRSFAGEIVPYQFPILEMGLFILVLFGLEFLLSA